ncbi:8-amino-7-oxononanoate synthase [Tamlana fucoidanivorans]|uniref:8-amino-7-oxononanoate synthase n=1 Tax=Allotamlana fucoidanivorans TaxID=2583814 RepID=A0A5C4SRB8_9FLAO|nr:8-amino-7-oxononanoate synthase [Tamlana fucoidanivorans]TNJ46976.1 8-amino-7-oxononanoate synthase [Tamlana fucoidanivorans]
MFPKKLHHKLEEREASNALRALTTPTHLIDFSSNDYLGFAKNKTIFKQAHDYLNGHGITQNGATGSRLLSGNHALYPLLENSISNVHNSDAALIFNSGYDANIGFFSSVPQRGDIIFFDEYIHASIRDGISMSHAKSYKFKHNDLVHLEALLRRIPKDQNIYVVTESVFSMDGDTPNLKALSKLCITNKALLIIDEAHAIGVFGNKGEGLVQHLKLEASVFARLITFGKAMGCHGAAILGSAPLKQYLINFCRSLIYTTALPPHSLSTIHAAYNELFVSHSKQQLHQNILHFKNGILKHKLQNAFIESHSAIHCCIVSGNDRVKTIAKTLQNKGFDVKPILSPTVPKGQERLRFCLHSYNTETDIEHVLQLLSLNLNP